MFHINLLFYLRPWTWRQDVRPKHWHLHVRIRASVCPLPNICDLRSIVTLATLAALPSGMEPPMGWVDPSASLDVSASAGTRSPDAVHRCLITASAFVSSLKTLNRPVWKPTCCTAQLVVNRGTITGLSGCHLARCETSLPNCTVSRLQALQAATAHLTLYTNWLATVSI